MHGEIYQNSLLEEGISDIYVYWHCFHLFFLSASYDANKSKIFIARMQFETQEK